jgi:hypothetical protein
MREELPGKLKDLFVLSYADDDDISNLNVEVLDNLLAKIKSQDVKSNLDLSNQSDKKDDSPTVKVQGKTQKDLKRKFEEITQKLDQLIVAIVQLTIPIDVISVIFEYLGFNVWSKLFFISLKPSKGIVGFEDYHKIKMKRHIQDTRKDIETNLILDKLKNQRERRLENEQLKAKTMRTQTVFELPAVTQVAIYENAMEITSKQKVKLRRILFDPLILSKIDFKIGDTQVEIFYKTLKLYCVDDYFNRLILDNYLTNKNVQDKYNDNLLSIVNKENEIRIQVKSLTIVNTSQKFKSTADLQDYFKQTTPYFDLLLSRINTTSLTFESCPYIVQRLSQSTKDWIFDQSRLKKLKFKCTSFLDIGQCRFYVDADSAVAASIREDVKSAKKKHKFKILTDDKIELLGPISKFYGDIQISIPLCDLELLELNSLYGHRFCMTLSEEQVKNKSITKVYSDHFVSLVNIQKAVLVDCYFSLSNVRTLEGKFGLLHVKCNDVRWECSDDSFERYIFDNEDEMPAELSCVNLTCEGIIFRHGNHLAYIGYEVQNIIFINCSFDECFFTPHTNQSTQHITFQYGYITEKFNESFTSFIADAKPRVLENLKSVTLIKVNESDFEDQTQVFIDLLKSVNRKIVIKVE